VDVIDGVHKKDVAQVFAGMKDKYREMISQKLQDKNMDDIKFYPNVRSFFN
jgi:hypothetical protein